MITALFNGTTRPTPFETTSMASFVPCRTERRLLSTGEIGSNTHPTSYPSPSLTLLSGSIIVTDPKSSPSSSSVPGAVVHVHPQWTSADDHRHRRSCLRLTRPCVQTNVRRDDAAIDTFIERCCLQLLGISRPKMICRSG